MFALPRFVRWPLALSALTAVTLVGSGCSDDDDDDMTGTGSGTTVFRVSIENVSEDGDFPVSGVFDTPATGRGAGPIGPGQAYEFQFGASPGDHLSFATMFVQSNDLFYAPSGMGIPLFSGETPVSGDVTDQVMLWDAGTEMNEEPGAGPNQAPRQSGPDTGAADMDMAVRPVSDAYTYPAPAEVIGVTLTSHGEGLFTARIENRSEVGTIETTGGMELAVPLAPGVFVIHTESNPLFTDGTPGGDAGLEGLAEDGAAAPLGESLAARTGISSPFAPGVFAVHEGGVQPLFTAGSVDRGDGLVALAEDGDPSGLAAALEGDAMVDGSGSYSVPVGGSGGAPIPPGQSYSFTFEGIAGDYLSFATMFVQSNDLFVSPASMGIALFSGSTPVDGNLTDQVMLWDVGSERNQWPGVGPDQAPRQSGADTGDDDPGDTVRLVDDGFAYPAIGNLVEVSISVVN